MTTTNIGACGCCVQGPQCCCDETGPHELNANEECTGSQFNRPNPVPNISLIFEWCGLTAERTLLGGLDSYYDSETIDLYICDNTGRYGGESSYIRAYQKYISVYIFPNGGGGYCGYNQRFLVSVSFPATGYKDSGGGNFFAIEAINGYAIVYDATLSVCYDGSGPVVEMTPLNEPENYGCNGPGAWEECMSTEPEITVIGAP